MKKVFLDTNVLLDALESSHVRHEDCMAILSMAGNGHIEAVVSTQSLVDVAYVYTKGNKARLQELRTLLAHFDDILTIRDTSRRAIMLASQRFTDDFEDAVQASIALDAGCEIIITSDTSFDDPFGLPLVHPSAFCQEMFIA